MEMLVCYFLQVAGSKGQTIDIGSVKIQSILGIQNHGTHEKTETTWRKRKKKGIEDTPQAQFSYIYNLVRHWHCSLSKTIEGNNF